jgi:hypothetical protein
MSESDGPRFYHGWYANCAVAIDLSLAVSIPGINSVTQLFQLFAAAHSAARAGCSPRGRHRHLYHTTKPLAPPHSLHTVLLKVESYNVTDVELREAEGRELPAAAAPGHQSQDAFGYTGTVLRELGWETPTFSGRVVPKTPNASYIKRMAIAPRWPEGVQAHHLRPIYIVYLPICDSREHMMVPLP